MKNILVTVFLMIFETVALCSQKADFRKIRSASEYDYPPFCVMNEESTAGGFSVELLSAACEAMNIDISFKVGEWSIIKQELVDGKLDVLPLVGRTREREYIYDFTIPYLTFHGAVFVKTGEARINTINDLKNKTIQVLKGDIAEEYIRRDKISDLLVTVESFETAFRNLSEGKCDAVIAQEVMGLNLIDQLNLKNVSSLSIELKGFRQDFCFAVKNENDSLLALINEGLSIIIANGTFERLHQKWFSPQTKLGKTRIIIGDDSQYPPYSFIDENNMPAGFNVDLSRAVAKELGILVDIRLGIWSDIRRSVENGQIDMISGMFYSKERDSLYDFSPPHSISSHAIVVRKGSEVYDTIENLRNKKILVEKGDIMQDYLKSNGFDKEIVAVESQEKALILLSQGKYDCALVSKILSHYLIDENKIKNLFVSEKSFLPQEYCFAVKNGNQILLRQLSNALANVKASGEYRKIYSKWFGTYEKSKTDYRRIVKYSAAILIPLLMLIVGIILWNRTLQKQVRKKTIELAEREELLYGLFDNIPNGSAIYEVLNRGESGSDYIIKYFNKQSLQIEGATLDKVIGKSLKDLRPNIDEYGLIPVLKKVWETGQSEFFPAKVYKDNRYSNYYENIVFRLPAGEVVTIYDDVTEKMNAILKVKESEEKYRQIYESASEGIFMTKPDGTILSANPEACRIFQRTEGEIIGLGRDKLFDITDPKFIESLEIRKRTGKFKGEIICIKKDGTHAPVYLTSNIYMDSKGDEKTITIFTDIFERKQNEARIDQYLRELEKNKNAMLNILKDVNQEVTERRKAQEELKILNTELEERVKERTLKLEEQNKALSAAQESLIMLLEDVNDARKQLTEANEKLVAANKELEAFSYSVSHDLRSPLRAIVGFSDILMEDYCKDLNDEGKRYIERITENTQKMQKLIDDLLEYSRVGKSSVRLQNIETVKMLTKIFEDIKAGEGERKFDFSVDGLIPDIMADRTLVTQMFQNLIGNAVKFTGKKEVAVIKINYENDGIFHIISIKDNGAGFDEKYKSKLFEVFQRLHSTEDFPGTGVGMSIVAKVVSKHGWSIDAESKNGDGAVFYIKIPVEQKKELQIEERI